MRPLTLRMSGLRSYRSEVTIDFGDPGLIAIVGDTGAGKSSILEALFFALYGGCTWDHRATAPLISDGASRDASRARLPRRRPPLAGVPLRLPHQHAEPPRARMP